MVTNPLSDDLLSELDKIDNKYLRTAIKNISAGQSEKLPLKDDKDFQRQFNRLCVLALKHCPQMHRDFKEICEISDMFYE